MLVSRTALLRSSPADLVHGLRFGIYISQGRAFQISDLKVRVSGCKFGFSVSVFGVWVQSAGFRAQGLGLRAESSGFQVLGYL